MWRGREREIEREREWNRKGDRGAEGDGGRVRGSEREREREREGSEGGGKAVEAFFAWVRRGTQRGLEHDGNLHIRLLGCKPQERNWCNSRSLESQRHFLRYKMPPPHNNSAEECEGNERRRHIVAIHLFLAAYLKDHFRNLGNITKSY